MALSVHDNYLISYEVQCEKRTILLRTEYREQDKLTEFTNVYFEEVQAYHFENDAFGNIILDVNEVALEGFLKDYGAEILELCRMTGRPTWAADLASAPGYLREQGIRAFLLSPTLGLNGWILAREMSIFPANAP